MGEELLKKWDKRFIEQCRFVGEQCSKDPESKNGALVVDDLRRVRGQGYNGFPRGVRDDAARYMDRFVKLKLVVHAEVNAIINAMSIAGIAGCTLYTTKFPCTDCAKLICQCGIGTVVTPEIDRASSWAEDQSFSWQMFNECGVQVVFY